MIPRHLFIAISVLLLAVLGMSIYAWRMRGTGCRGSRGFAGQPSRGASRRRSHRASNAVCGV